MWTAFHSMKHHGFHTATIELSVTCLQYLIWNVTSISLELNNHITSFQLISVHQVYILHEWYVLYLCTYSGK